ncbi:MAG: MoaD/ThiS family protein [Candidatus Thorarchaeota archaeon]|jgi:molybdopterin converting factor small subunit
MVNVKLYAGLRKFAPKDNDLGDFFQVDIQGKTVNHLIKKLGIREVHVQIVMVNGERIIENDYTLEEDDLVVIFPPIGGG